MEFGGASFHSKECYSEQNTIICQQSDSEQEDRKTLGLVYAINALCLFVTMHINLLYNLVLEELKERECDMNIYHKDETPFSMTRLIPRMSAFAKQAESRKTIPVSEPETTRHDIANCGEYVLLAFSLPVAVGYYVLIYQIAWVEKVIFHEWRCFVGLHYQYLCKSIRQKFWFHANLV